MKNSLISFAILIAFVLSTAYLLALNKYKITPPDQVVKEFYDSGADYSTNPDLVAKVRKLNIEAGDPTGGTGFYDDGYIHGIDYDPMFCAQDVPGSRTYKTISQSDDKATVEAHHMYDKDYVFNVLLQMKNNKWNIVDVICPI